MAETHFDEWIAAHMERLWPDLFDPSVLQPTVDVLAELAGAGPALEFGVGTGRVAVPLSRQGVRVQGIELSVPMAAQLDARGATGVGVVIGDFATTRVPGSFALVFLLRNTITNLTTQEEQVEAFCNAGAHLAPGGLFVVENYIPELRRLPPGETRRIFAATPDHVGFEDYDVASQIAVSYHYWIIDGELKTLSSPHRYLWPSELDLMARIAGMTCGIDGATGTRLPSPAKAEATSRCGRSQPDRGVVTPSWGRVLPSQHASEPLLGRGLSWRHLGARPARP